MALKYGSSMTDPSYANYQGSQTYNYKPVASSGGKSVNAQGLPQITGGGSVLGASTSAGGGGGNQSAWSSAGHAGIAPVGYNGEAAAGVLQQAPAQPQIDFDALIRPALDSLNAYIPTVQSGYDTNVSDINAAKTNQLASNQSNIQGQTNTLEQARTSQQNLSESAADEARRQYAEIQQGLQSRYGGTTGTGAFATEIAGRQTLQNIGKIRQGLSEAMLQIDNKLQQVQEIGRIASVDIEDKAREQINQAKQQLDLSLADIRRQQGELQSRKAELAANAMQVYQQTVSNVNAQNASFKQNLYLSQVNAENQLKAAQQQAQGVAQSYSLQNPDIGQQVTPIGGSVQQTQPTQPSIQGGGDLYDRLKTQFLG